MPSPGSPQEVIYTVVHIPSIFHSGHSSGGRRPEVAQTPADPEDTHSTHATRLSYTNRLSFTSYYAVYTSQDNVNLQESVQDATRGGNECVKKRIGRGPFYCECEFIAGMIHGFE